MNPDDFDDYYVAQHDARHVLEERLYAAFPEITSAADAIDPPVVRLLCRRGHHILPVTLHVNPNGGLSIVPASRERSGRQVARNVHPLADTGVWGSCAEPSCTTLVARPAWFCPDHEPEDVGADETHGVGADETHGVRVELTCPQRRCTYAGVHLHVRLLKLYAAALRLGVSEIRLPS